LHRVPERCRECSPVSIAIMTRRNTSSRNVQRKETSLVSKMYSARVSSAKCEAKITREGADRLHVYVSFTHAAQFTLVGVPFSSKQRFSRDDRQSTRRSSGSEALSHDREEPSEPFEPVSNAGFAIEAHRKFPPCRVLDPPGPDLRRRGSRSFGIQQVGPRASRADAES